jgi:hypothetical protein
MYGFIKSFPSYTIGYYSTGTGFAGIFSTATLYISTGLFKLEKPMLFLIETPTIIIYFFAFFWLDNQKRLYSKDE